MKLLLCGSYHPRGTLSYYEAAFAGRGCQVTYAGVPYRCERAGYAPDLDLREPVASGDYDLVFYVEDRVGRPCFPRGLAELPIPTVGYLPDAALGTPAWKSMALFFDYVMLSTRWLMPAVASVHPRVFFLPFAYDPERMPAEAGEPLYEVAFVGRLKPERRPLLERLAREFRTNDFGRWADLDEIGRIYGRSKIVFNRPPLGGREHNMRVFEAMGCGSLLLTERIPDDPLFVDGEHLVSYDGEEDLLRKIRYYLAHEAERRRIAGAGRELVRRRHTYRQRAQQVLELVEEHGRTRLAPLRRAGPERRFLETQRVYAHQMLIDSMAGELARAEVSPAAKLRALGWIGVALLRRIKNLAWKRILQRPPAGTHEAAVMSDGGRRQAIG